MSGRPNSQGSSRAFPGGGDAPVFAPSRLLPFALMPLLILRTPGEKGEFNAKPQSRRDAKLKTKTAENAKNAEKNSSQSKSAVMTGQGGARRGDRKSTR